MRLTHSPRRSETLAMKDSANCSMLVVEPGPPGVCGVAAPEPRLGEGKPVVDEASVGESNACSLSAALVLCW